MDKEKISSSNYLSKEFRLLQDNNEIVAKIYSTKLGKKETVTEYNRRLKEFLGRMAIQPINELKKR